MILSLRNKQQLMKQYNGNKLAKELKNMRFVELDWGMREAAKKIGVSVATLSRLEHGKAPDVNTLFAVCKWLDKPMEHFFTEINKTK